MIFAFSVYDIVIDRMRYDLSPVGMFTTLVRSFGPFCVCKS